MILKALLMVEEGEFSNLIIGKALDKYAKIDVRDRALFVRTVHGTLEYQLQIDAIIDRFSKVKVRKMKPMIRNILRMSIYQIFYLDKIPVSAIVDEAVKLVRKSPLKNLGGFVNGVLRSIVREKDTIDFSDRAFKYSIKPEILDIIEETIAFSLNGHYSNAGKCMTGTEGKRTECSEASDNENSAKLLTDAFMEYTLSDHGTFVRTVGTDEVRLIDDVGNLTESDDWKEGRIIVQDYASTLPVRMSSIKETDIVIDVCASPGGKSIQAAEKAGRVIACDISEKKLERIHENIERLRVSNIECKVCDATVFNTEFDSLADVVIADLPCSGLGTIGKKPEIKNRITVDDLKALAEIQMSILNNVCRYVKPDGELVFSTCTVDHFENADNTEAFVRNHPEFSVIEEKQFLPTDTQPMDGFYVCIMHKKK